MLVVLPIVTTLIIDGHLLPAVTARSAIRAGSRRAADTRDKLAGAAVAGARQAKRRYIDPMETVLSGLLVLTLIAVSLVLFMGIGSMSRGGEFNRKHGNRLMRWRVGLQALAVLIIIALFFVHQA